MNISSAKIRKDMDLNWYISVHQETSLCVNVLQPNNPTVNTMKDASFQAPSFIMKVNYGNLQQCEVENVRNMTTDNVVETVFYDNKEIPIHENIDYWVHGSKAENVVRCEE